VSSRCKVRPSRATAPPLLLPASPQLRSALRGGGGPLAGAEREELGGWQGRRGGGAVGRWGNEGRGVTRQPGGSYAKAGQRRPGRLKPAQNLYVWTVLSWNGRSSRLMKCTMFWLRISDTLNCRCRIMCRDWPSLWKDDIAQQNLQPKLLFWMSRLPVLDNSLACSG